MTATNTFFALLVLASACTLVLYLMMIAASWQLQRQGMNTVAASGNARPFVLPFGPLVPILAALAVLWLLSQTSL